jgi:hypothetical protein
VPADFISTGFGQAAMDLRGGNNSVFVILHLTPTAHIEGVLD